MTEKRVKLSKKQLQLIQSFEKQKAELNQAFQAVSEKEGMVVQLVAEANGIEAAKSLQLDGEFLVFKFEEKKVKKDKKTEKEIKAE